MSQIVAAVRPTAFVFLPVQFLPVRDDMALAEITQTYQRALEEAQAVVRSSIGERVFAFAQN